VMEEWAERHGQSVASQFAQTRQLSWANVGTPDETQFRTYTGPVNYPGHDGPNGDWDAPGMDQYGPYENQESRELRMAANVDAEMKSYEAGLFILGLAHMHSIFGKLRSLEFNVTGYSWL